tara:strand:+ start:534 stop:899 length:366 start_codon:yes stop_codon:yes gene_type:complete
MLTAKMESRIQEFVGLVRTVGEEYRQFCTNGTLVPADKVSVSFGRKYAKIVHTGEWQTMVHSFVDTTNGDILMAATWKAPVTKSPRGNIFADDLGRSAITAHGARYSGQDLTEYHKQVRNL